MKTLLFAISALLAFAPTILCAQVPGNDLVEFPDCKLIPDQWGDGDSFFIETGNREKHRIRLYGVDCLETGDTDANNARRLLEQRRHFGISNSGGSAQPQASITLAKKYGKLAAEETTRALAEPFTIHTSFANAGGDPRSPRIYAFVTTADGKDLGELLVSNGLARAHGICRARHDGQHRDIYKERLRDVELIACREESGIWVETDCDKLSKERELQREEDADLGLGPKTPPATMLDLNTAARDELMKIPDVGEKMADRIIEGRPYATFEKLDEVEGVGPKTLDELKKYGRIADQKRDPAKPSP